MSLNLGGSLGGKIDDMLEGSVAGSLSFINGANLETLNVTENGTYTPEAGVDGYNKVVVDVDTPQPTLETLNVTENGTYTPEAGVDGYNEVVVDVPIPTSFDLPILEDYPYKHNNSDSSTTDRSFNPYSTLPSGITTDNIKLSLTALSYTGTSNFTSTTTVSGIDLNNNAVLLSWGEQAGTSKQYFDIIVVPDTTKYHILSEWTTINQNTTTLSVQLPNNSPRDFENYIIEFKDAVTGVTGVTENIIVNQDINNNTFTISIPINSSHHAITIRLCAYY